MKWLERLAKKYAARTVNLSRPDAETPYLTRYYLADRFPSPSLYLHRFHRSDEDDMHDHPWPFIYRKDRRAMSPFAAVCHMADIASSRILFDVGNPSVGRKEQE